MKILICSTAFPGLAGIPKYTKGISKEFLKRGHRVCVLCEKEKKKKDLETLDKIKIYRHKTCSNLRKEIKIIKARTTEIKEEFDLIIVLWYKYFKPLKEAFPKSKFIYIVPSVRKVDIDVLNRNHAFFKRKYYHFVNRFSISLEKEAIFNADLVVALGKQMKEQIQKNYEFSNSKIINPGVDKKLFRYKKKKKDDTFLIVANLDPRKGIDRAIETAKFLKKGKIKILGGGKRMSFYNNMINKKGVKSKIILNGPSTNVPGEMLRAKALIMTSYSEGFPLIFPEALACGLPIIAFKSDGREIMNAANEVILDGENGFLVTSEKEMAKKIDLIAGNNVIQKKMSEESLKQSIKFSWKNVAEELLMIFHHSRQNKLKKTPEKK
jgi:glycosyltransferase involved in cell wall biosynthesis